MRAARATAMLAAAGLATACATAARIVNPAVEPSVSVDAITDDPDAFYGQRVTLTARVDEVFGRQQFTLADSDPTRKERLLVLTHRPRPAGEATAVAPRDVLVVEGTVRRLVASEIEREAGVELEPALVKRFENRPVLVAREIRTVGTVEDEPSR
jgi:hypothetical protein